MGEVKVLPPSIVFFRLRLPAWPPRKKVLGSSGFRVTTMS